MKVKAPDVFDAFINKQLDDVIESSANVYTDADMYKALKNVSKNSRYGKRGYIDEIDDVSEKFRTHAIDEYRKNVLGGLSEKEILEILMDARPENFI